MRALRYKTRLTITGSLQKLSTPTGLHSIVALAVGEQQILKRAKKQPPSPVKSHRIEATSASNEPPAITLELPESVTKTGAKAGTAFARKYLHTRRGELQILHEQFELQAASNFRNNNPSNNNGGITSVTSNMRLSAKSLHDLGCPSSIMQGIRRQLHLHTQPSHSHTPLELSYGIVSADASALTPRRPQSLRHQSSSGGKLNRPKTAQVRKNEGYAATSREHYFEPVVAKDGRHIPVLPSYRCTRLHTDAKMQRRR
jgi:hypothetical protein